MRQAEGDLFAMHDSGLAIAVTTSGLVGRDGLARFGAGCARTCAQRFAWFATKLGASILADGLRTVHLGERVVAFPIENTPYDYPDTALIARSARELVALVDQEHWSELALPRPGCGHGGLEWANVRPILQDVLDDRFIVVTLQNGLDGG